VPGEGAFTYNSGTVVNLQAVAEAGYHFVNWIGPVTNPNTASTTITINGTKAVTAVFAANIPEGFFTLTVISEKHGDVASPGVSVFIYSAGTIVNLEVKAEEKHHFGGWTGDISTIEDPNATTTKIHMDGNYIITASFVKD
jgi:hypothetical protein